MIKKLLFLFTLILLSSCVFAQTANTKKAQERYEDAQQYIRQNAWDEGIRYLEEALVADSKFKAAWIQLGDIYRKLKNYPKAKVNYTGALDIGAVIEPRIYFVLAEAELLCGEYEKAKIHLLQFQQKNSIQDTSYNSKAKKYIADCEFALKAIDNPISYQPKNMGFNINSEYRDYFPSLTADGERIIFSRVVNGNEDFYTSNKINDKWNMASPLSTVLNTPQFNEGAQSISPDGKYLFFTGCNRPDGLGRCDLYISIRHEGEWGKAVNLGPTINSEFWESQPSISPDGNTLYFVSNRPGGYGGYDIWKSTLNDDAKWTTPENLGPKINTPYDENTPFIHADGKTLYFSSDGWPGLGQKDLFFSRLTPSNTWEIPVNLGYPINTFNEEVGLMVTTDGQLGIFSSNLDGGFGEMDIYSFQMPTSAKPSPTAFLKGKIRNRETTEFVEAQVLIIDLKTNKLLFNDVSSSLDGEFLTVLPTGSSYLFNIIAPGYMFYAQHFDLVQDNLGKPLIIDILLDPIKLGAQATLANIFFETNKSELLPSSINELNIFIEFLTNNPSVEIEIRGHTDNQGANKLNEKLSADRAKSVYSYLIENGISSKRLNFKGFGAKQPVTNNETAAGRQQNRRTEFIISKL